MGNFEDEQSKLELREFIRRLDGQKTDVFGKKLSSGRRKRRKRKFSVIDIPEVLWFASGIGICLTIILIGILLCKVPIMPVIAVVTLETALAVCLNQAPFWLHIAVIGINVVLGIIFHMLGVMLLASIVYVIAIILSYKHQGRIGGY